MNILELRNLTIKAAGNPTLLVNNVSVSVSKDSCLGIVGESGSGKTMLCRSIFKLLDNNLQVNGECIFDGMDISTKSREQMRHLLGKRCCMILQNPMMAFDPLLTIGIQMCETICHSMGVNQLVAMDLAKSSLIELRLDDACDIMSKYPHQLSGGMLQRIMIALALIPKPDLIIADEPTTALDMVTQNEVMAEFVRLRQETQTAMIFVSHDLGVIAQIADNILVMNNGKAVEYGSKAEILSNPSHEYTRYLVNTRKALERKYYAVLAGKQEVVA